MRSGAAILSTFFPRRVVFTTTFLAGAFRPRTRTLNVCPARAVSEKPFVPRRVVTGSSGGPVSVIFAPLPEVGTNLTLTVPFLSPLVPNSSAKSPLKVISTNAEVAVDAPSIVLTVTALR